MAHQNEFILDLLDFALHDNFFQFSETYQQQLPGTCSGHHGHPPIYACLHLGFWVEVFVYELELFNKWVGLWLRYIDDVLVLWKCTISDLPDFIDKLNDS